MPPRQPPSADLRGIVRKVMLALEASDLTVIEVARRAGVYDHGLSRWRQGVNEPGALKLEAVAEVLGYRLVLEPIDGRLPQETVPQPDACQL